jgi:hypothetical protein
VPKLASKLPSLSYRAIASPGEKSNCIRRIGDPAEAHRELAAEAANALALQDDGKIVAVSRTGTSSSRVAEDRRTTSSWRG